MTYILSIDQGTTGTTVMLVNSKTLQPIEKINTEFQQYFPQSSWVEHDLNEIWESVKSSCLELFNKTQVSAQQILAIGITNQRETVCAYDKKGNPLAKAIVWQDRRTQEKCQSLQKEYKDSELYLKTGLPLDAYFSATKMNWLLENNLNIQNALKDNNLNLSTIDSFLLYKLTNTSSFFTDATNASRTMLMDLSTCQWDDELLHFFNIPKSALPNIQPSMNNFGQTKSCDFLPDGIPIHCLIGDQQSALLGQGCIKENQMKCTYGTGAFLLLNTGETICRSDHGLLTTIALKTKTKTTYALEGSTYIAGAAIQWLRDNLNFFENSKDIEKLINTLDENEIDEISDLYFFPFFTGIGTPFWKSHAKAAIVGMTRSTQKKHLTMAALEGIALSVNDTIEVFRKANSSSIESMRVDGGASLNKRLMEIQSSFSDIKITRPRHIETTALGAAYGAYLSFNDLELDKLSSILEKNETIQFQKESSEYAKKKKSFWKKYIERNF